MKKKVYHYWISNISGMVFSTDKKCPILVPRKTEVYKYVGYTTDIHGDTFTMNTGRVFYGETKQIAKKRRKRRIRKLSSV